jgi:hypothetical protein
MKRYLVLLLLLVVLFTCGLVPTQASNAALSLTVTVTPGANLNVTYTAKLIPPFDAPKLVNFYTAPANGSFTFVGSAWTNEPQIATFSFHQASGSYKGKATCDLLSPYGLVESNIVSYNVP